ncbi:hypothetical protein BH23ACT11_BH23ACT11_16780 [soil metagenome]
MLGKGAPEGKLVEYFDEPCFAESSIAQLLKD